VVANGRQNARGFHVVSIQLKCAGGREHRRFGVTRGKVIVGAMDQAIAFEP
jgi:hypothetical protein